MKTCLVTAMLLLFLCDQFASRYGVHRRVKDEFTFPSWAQGNNQKRERDLQRQREAAESEIRHESERLRISNLRDVAISDGVETRIWVAFGHNYPRCVVLRTTDRENKAVYIRASDVKGGLSTPIDGVFIHQTPLGAPKFGWNNLLNFLKEQGVYSPIQLSLDSQHLVDPDEEFIVLEVKSEGVYSMAFFSRYTEATDGRKALAVCHRIEEEFDVRMRC